MGEQVEEDEVGVDAPLQHRLQVRFGVAQIGLQDDAGIGPVPELRLVHHLAEDTERRLLVGVLLHIDIDEGALGSGLRQDRTQPLLDRASGALHVHRIKMRGERRQLERDVQPRHRAERRLIELRIRRRVPAEGG